MPSPVIVTPGHGQGVATVVVVDPDRRRPDVPPVTSSSPPLIVMLLAPRCRSRRAPAEPIILNPFRFERHARCSESRSQRPARRAEQSRLPINVTLAVSVWPQCRFAADAGPASINTAPTLAVAASRRTPLNRIVSLPLSVPKRQVRTYSISRTDHQAPAQDGAGHVAVARSRDSVESRFGLAAAGYEVAVAVDVRLLPPVLPLPAIGNPPSKPKPPLLVAELFVTASGCVVFDRPRYCWA